MIHVFKVNGDRFVFDRGSGSVSSISSLQYKMLSYLKPPLTSELPTSLRYDLAKFDSGMVEDAYDGLYTLWEQGKLFSEESVQYDCHDCWAAGICALGGRCDSCESELHRLEHSVTAAE